MLSYAFSLTQRHQQGEWDLCEEGRRRTAFIVDLCWKLAVHAITRLPFRTETETSRRPGKAVCYTGGISMSFCTDVLLSHACMPENEQRLHPIRTRQ